ncbi:hypothetical protein, partial [uncultured Bacteroides sp.]
IGFFRSLGLGKEKRKKTSGKIWKLCFKNLRLTSHSFVIVTEQSWCKMSFFWKNGHFSSFLSIQYQIDFCNFGVNLIEREKITQLIL